MKLNKKNINWKEKNQRKKNKAKHYLMNSAYKEGYTKIPSWDYNNLWKVNKTNHKV
jgi:hypothetical protein